MEDRVIVQAAHGTKFSLYDVSREEYEHAEKLWNEQQLSWKLMKQRYPDLKVRREGKPYRHAGQLSHIQDTDYSGRSTATSGDLGLMVIGSLAEPAHIVRKRLDQKFLNLDAAPDERLREYQAAYGLDIVTVMDTLWQHRLEQKSELLDILEGEVHLLRLTYTDGSQVAFAYLAKKGEEPRVEGNTILDHEGTKHPWKWHEGWTFGPSPRENPSQLELIKCGELSVVRKALGENYQQDKLLLGTKIEIIPTKDFARDILGPFLGSDSVEEFYREQRLEF